MNLVQKAVAHGGKLAPLIIPNLLSAMNPSVMIDDDGDILVNVRVVNYAYYHSEGKQRFASRWGVLSYLHPEKDPRLVTENYICRLNSNLEIVNCAKVEMLNWHKPIWDFVGLEDARLYRWNGDLYMVGVRRDTKTNGEGRMEYSRIALDKKNWTAKEVGRKRIPAPDDHNDAVANKPYCEKNWMGISDRPYHFVKWTSPTEVVFSDPDSNSSTPSTQVLLRNGVSAPKDQRGGSQVIPWGNMYIAITHEVDLWHPHPSPKDALYRHRLCVWDQQFNLVGVSKEFSFLDAHVEFSVGLAKHGDNALVSFSAQDNVALILEVPRIVMEDLILDAIND